MPGGAQRTRRPDVRPEQILDAAEVILAEVGLAGLTMDSVAARARIAKGTTYHYYRSKAEVLSALRHRYLTRHVARAEDAARRTALSGTIERVDTFFATIVQTSIGDADLVRALFHSSPIEEADEVAIMHVALRNLLSEGIEAGDVVLHDADFTARFLVLGFHGLAHGVKNGSERARLLDNFAHTTRALLAQGP